VEPGDFLRRDAFEALSDDAQLPCVEDFHNDFGPAVSRAEHDVARAVAFQRALGRPRRVGASNGGQSEYQRLSRLVTTLLWRRLDYESTDRTMIDPC
jgi:hypothetical protein